MKHRLRLLTTCLATAILFLIVSVACGHQPATSGTAVKRYNLTGTVQSKDVTGGELIIANDDIPGFMGPMTMPYPVEDAAALRDAQPGDHITAQIVVAADGSTYWLEHVVLSGPTAANPAAPVIKPAPIVLSAAVSDAPMTTQDGDTLRLRQLRGKAVLLTFIYTRCPLPTACPLLTSRFAQIETRLAKDPRAYANSHLVSISLDPDYDKPPVLRRYGLAYLDDNAAAFAHWSFVAASTTNLKTLAQAFGLEYSLSGNQISHSMRTVLIGPDAKVVQSWDGSAWDPVTVAKAVEEIAGHAAK